jgi:hypothetical protein
MFCSVLEARKDVSYWLAALAGSSTDFRFPQRGVYFHTVHCAMCMQKGEGREKADRKAKSVSISCRVPSNRVMSTPFSHKTIFSQNFVKVPHIFFLVVNS